MLPRRMTFARQWLIFNAVAMLAGYLVYTPIAHGVTGGHGRDLTAAAHSVALARCEETAAVAHFPEAVCRDMRVLIFESYRRFNGALLEASTRQILDLAKELGIWVLRCQW